jgi:hypothetical protein
MKISENYITELCDRPNLQESLEVGTIRKETADKKGAFIFLREVENLSRRRRIRRLQEMMMYLGTYSDSWEKMV